MRRPPLSLSLYSSILPASPKALRRSSRLRPALALTPVPGLSAVPFADAVMFLSLRSSMLIHTWFLHISAVAL